MSYEVPLTMNCPIHGPTADARYIGEGLLQICAECDPEEPGEWAMPCDDDFSRVVLPAGPPNTDYSPEFDIAIKITPIIPTQYPFPRPPKE